MKEKVWLKQLSLSLLQQKQSFMILDFFNLLQGYLGNLKNRNKIQTQEKILFSLHVIFFFLAAFLVKNNKAFKQCLNVYCWLYNIKLSCCWRWPAIKVRNGLLDVLGLLLPQVAVQTQYTLPYDLLWALKGSLDINSTLGQTRWLSEWFITRCWLTSKWF